MRKTVHEDTRLRKDIFAVLLALQVFLGYVLLGALVTRFAVLFTAGGPAGTFARDRGQKTDDRNQKTEDRG
jgi:hypothetical protein